MKNAWFPAARLIFQEHNIGVEIAIQFCAYRNTGFTLFAVRVFLVKILNSTVIIAAE
jgi:hypothetical protein